jgi:hypothetical protein
MSAFREFLNENIDSDEKAFLKKFPDAKITFKKKNGDKIYYVNGQTAFNGSDKGFNSTLIQQKLERAYKASKL